MVFQKLCEEKKRLDCMKSIEEHPLIVQAHMNECVSNIHELSRQWWQDNSATGHIIKTDSEILLCVGHTKDELVLVGRDKKVRHYPIEDISLTSKKGIFVYNDKQYEIGKYFFEDRQTPPVMQQEYMEEYCTHLKKAKSGDLEVAEIFNKVNRSNIDTYFSIYEEKMFESEFFKDMAKSYETQLLLSLKSVSQC